MKKLVAALFLGSFCLFAADFWQGKPFAEWSDKDVQRMMNNSPWARAFSVPMSGPTPPALGGGGGGGGGESSGAPISEGGGGGRGGRGGGGGGSGGGPGGGPDMALNLVARWQSALPVKQAFVRMKYGEKADSSPEAKQLLERQEETYVIILSGNLRSLLIGNPDTVKKSIADMTSLSAKGKDPAKPLDLQVANNQIVFLFPKTSPWSLDDKEVEFSTKLADVVLKYKFKLKDMVYNGKLEL
jgi:hypothetical protein